MLNKNAYSTTDLSVRFIAQMGINTKTPREHFNDYLRYGSFPYVSMLEHTDSIITPYIDGIYNTILIKDVAKREGITDVSLLKILLNLSQAVSEVQFPQRKSVIPLVRVDEKSQ